jgi:hypothetical protein
MDADYHQADAGVDPGQLNLAIDVLEGSFSFARDLRDKMITQASSGITEFIVYFASASWQVAGLRVVVPVPRSITHF